MAQRQIDPAVEEPAVQHRRFVLGARQQQEVPPLIAFVQVGGFALHKPRPEREHVLLAPECLLTDALDQHASAEARLELLRTGQV